MKLRTVLSFLTVTFILVCSTNYAQQEEMMKKWQEYMTPGDVHQTFAKLTGDWKATVTMYDPSGQEMSSEAVTTFEMILGGRYLKSTFKGNMMGMPYEGTGLDAYDNAAKEYLSTWVDNMGTGIMFMKGKWDDTEKAIVYLGTSTDPMTGKEQPVKSISKTIDDNHFVQTMFNVMDGKDIKAMEISYSR
jgi:hypothetical protein